MSFNSIFNIYFISFAIFNMSKAHTSNHNISLIVSWWQLLLCHKNNQTTAPPIHVLSSVLNKMYVHISLENNFCFIRTFDIFMKFYAKKHTFMHCGFCWVSRENMYKYYDLCMYWISLIISCYMKKKIIRSLNAFVVECETLLFVDLTTLLMFMMNKTFALIYLRTKTYKCRIIRNAVKREIQRNKCHSIHQRFKSI